MICGNLTQVRSLFCILAQYGVRPDRYICSDGELSEMYGTPCPDDGESRCYVRYVTNDKIVVGPGKVLVYTPVGKESQSADQLLIPKDFSPEVDPNDVFVIRSVSDADKVPSNAIVDIRPIGQKGIYASWNTLGGAELVNPTDIETRYMLGKAMHDKLAEKGGRFMITSFYPMGDNYRWLAKYDGFDYSDVTYVVMETAKDLPNLLGVDGVIISRGDIKCLKMYLAMTYHEDDRFKMIPYKPMYPGIMFHGDINISFFQGVTRRAREPALSVLEPIDDVGRLLKRSSFVGPRSVLLNPYGNSMGVRSEAEKNNTYETMRGLARRFLKRRYDVYTNTPFPEQKELPGTKRYEGDIVALANSAVSFDLVVTVFTGFMEVVMYTDCNLVVLNYSDTNSRMSMAKSLHRKNYWEFNVVNNKPRVLVSKISSVLDSLPVKKRLVYPDPPKRLMTLSEKADLFRGAEITQRLVRVVVFTAGKGELKELLDKGTRDPFLCCAGARALERGYQTKIDIPRAIKWYKIAGKLGVVWAKEAAERLSNKNK